MFADIVEKTINNWSISGIITSEDRDVYTYGLDLLLFTTLNIIVICISALLCGRLLETIVLLLVVIPMQLFCGGYHADTHLRCFLIMYIGWWLLRLIINIIAPATATIIAAASIIIIFLLAPVPNVNVPMSDNQRFKMRKTSRIVSVTVFFMSLLLLWVYPLNNIGIITCLGLGIIAFSMLCALVKTYCKQYYTIN